MEVWPNRSNGDLMFGELRNFGQAKTDLLGHGEQKQWLSDQGVNTVLQKSNVPST